MNQKLPSGAIETTCRELLQAHRRVTVRMVSEELRRRHHACGKSARVARILRTLAERTEVTRFVGPPEQEIARLRDELLLAREQVAKAEGRALLSEDRERAHQDFWAKRYVEKLDELDRQRTAMLKDQERAAAEQHLRLRQRMAELERENMLLKRHLAEEE